MGTASSQPEIPSHGTAPPNEPQHCPGMGDVTASQQPVIEAEHAHGEMGEMAGGHESSGSSLAEDSNKTGQDHTPESSRLKSNSLENIQELANSSLPSGQDATASAPSVGMPPPSPAVQVPDSQPQPTLAETAVHNAPISPPLSPRITVDPSVANEEAHTDERKRGKPQKGKQRSVVKKASKRQLDDDHSTSFRDRTRTLQVENSMPSGSSTRRSKRQRRLVNYDLTAPVHNSDGDGSESLYVNGNAEGHGERENELPETEGNEVEGDRAHDESNEPHPDAFEIPNRLVTPTNATVQITKPQDAHRHALSESRGENDGPETSVADSNLDELTAEADLDAILAFTRDEFFTEADRALHTAWDLHHPPKVRIRGKFTRDETEIVRRAIRDIQSREGYDTLELVELIQYPDEAQSQGTQGLERRLTEAFFPNPVDCNTFWQELFRSGLTRPPEQIKTHVRSRYHAYKASEWTAEEDQKLMDLMDEHYKQFSYISTKMDRSIPDIKGRWNSHLQNRENHTTFIWSRPESELLIRAVGAVVQRHELDRTKKGQQPICQYETKDINWTQVIRIMGGRRTQPQCIREWRRLKALLPTDKIPNRPIFNGERQLVVETAAAAGLEQTSNPGSDGEDTEFISAFCQKKWKGCGRPRKAENPTTVRKSRPGRAAKMRGGDQYDLVEKVLHQRPASETDIDWDRIKEVMEHHWPITTLQRTFIGLLDLAPAGTGFLDRVRNVFEFMSVTYSDNQLRDHYYRNNELEGEADDMEHEDTRTTWPNMEERRGNSDVPGQSTARTSKRRKSDWTPLGKSMVSGFVLDSEDEGEDDGAELGKAAYLDEEYLNGDDHGDNV